MSPALVIFLILACCQAVRCTDLCDSKDRWFDVESGECRPCKVCGAKAFLMEPCSDFMNTLCVDLVEIGRSIDRNIENGRQGQPADHSKRPRWHEVETADRGAGSEAPLLTSADVATSVFENFENEWGHIVMVVICITFFLVFGSVLILILRATRGRRCENRKNVARARLFSRDRLNTTEYMNNLATLDRRLAMDEILEKRKKAIFEPQLLRENVYTDEVFVDISGLPRNLHDDNEYDELDHSRCLLRIQDQQ